MEPELSSPVCFATQGDDVYMGYAGRDELVGAIRPLIAAEQALVRQAGALATGNARSIRTDAEHGCAVLADALQRLGGTGPAPADPLPDMREPVEPWRALHDGLDRIVVLLHTLIPRVRDERFRDQLAGLRDRHISSREALDQRDSPSSNDA
jgi:hypothetical protein